MIFFFFLDPTAYLNEGHLEEEGGHHLWLFASRRVTDDAGDEDDDARDEPAFVFSDANALFEI